MSFLEVKHQESAQRTLQRAIGRERMPHAYVFHGPQGVGKETLATAVAKFLLCPAPVTRDVSSAHSAWDGLDQIRDACGRCDDCRMVHAGTHPDLHRIYRQLHRSHPDANVRARKGIELGVDVMRHFLIDPAGMTPARGRARVFIIRDAERLNVEAQNALLKTLEEPPGPSYIILLITAIDRLLPTTLSRCQIVRFGALPTDFVRERLAAARPQVPADQAEWYARLAAGSVGRAVLYAEQGLFDINRQLADSLPAGTVVASADRGGRRTGPPPFDSLQAAAAWGELAKTLGGHHSSADPEITDTEATRLGVKALLLLAATWYADLLRIASGQVPAVNVAAGSRGPASRVPSSDRGALIARINRLTAAERQLDQNAHPQICLEVLAADLLTAGAATANPRAA